VDVPEPGNLEFQVNDRPAGLFDNSGNFHITITLENTVPAPEVATAPTPQPNDSAHQVSQKATSHTYSYQECYDIAGKAADDLSIPVPPECSQAQADYQQRARQAEYERQQQARQQRTTTIQQGAGRILDRILRSPARPGTRREPTPREPTPRESGRRR